jgi:hypothetical protein
MNRTFKIKKLNASLLRALKVASFILFAPVAFATQINLNLSSELKEKVENDLSFLENIVSAHTSPLHESIFGKVDGLSYKKWLEDRVSVISLDLNVPCENKSTTTECISDETGGAPKPLKISHSFYETNIPQVARASVLFHQARHLETNGTESYPHVACPIPFALGQQCDQNAQGAYAIQSIFLMNLSKNCADQSCNSKTRADASIYADQFRMRVINPSDRKAMKDDSTL